jgi:3-oxoacyl-[acyl-carrier protein] reductase
MSNKSFLLKGKSIVITGASRGLGAKIYEHLWGLGANVFAMSRKGYNIEVLDPVVENQYLYRHPIHLEEKNEIYALKRVYAEHFNSNVHAIINNAAIQGCMDSVAICDLEEWRRTLEVDLMAPVAIIHQLLAYMIVGSKIINIAGGGTDKARPGFSAYATAKTGLVRFTETLAEELKERRIDANIISPGAMYTDMTREVLGNYRFIEQEEFKAAEQTLSTGGADVDKTLSLIRWLLSSHSDGVTGLMIASQWDKWENIPVQRDDIREKNWYKLRRQHP